MDATQRGKKFTRASQGFDFLQVTSIVCWFRLDSFIHIVFLSEKIGREGEGKKKGTFRKKDGF